MASYSGGRWTKLALDTRYRSFSYNPYKPGEYKAGIPIKRTDYQTNLEQKRRVGVTLDNKGETTSFQPYCNSTSERCFTLDANQFFGVYSGYGLKAKQPDWAPGDLADARALAA